MATGGSDVIHNISENLPSCDVCQELFDTSSRTPRILRCFHAFCDECLRRLVTNNQVKCPVCRQSTTVEERLPVDITRMALLDMLKSTKSPEDVACEGCEEGAKAQYRCQDCADYLCGEYSEAHRRVKQTRNHRVVSLAEAAKDPSNFVQPIENCSRHTDKKLDMYCLTCKKCVCTKCALVMHKDGHQTAEIESVVETKKREMTSLCTQLQQLEPTFQSGLERAQGSLRTVDTNLQAAEQRVKEAADLIVRTARERERQLVEELRARAQRDRLSQQGQVDAFQSGLSAVQTAAGHGRRLISLNLTTQILQQTDLVQKTLWDAKKEVARRVETAPTYEVRDETMFVTDVIRESIKIADPEFVRGAEIPENTSCPAPGLEDRQVMLPAIMLDKDRCGPECTVENSCTLTNQPRTWIRASPFVFQFPGTYAKEGLVGSWYWQVAFTVTPRPCTEISLCFCAIGVGKESSRNRGKLAGCTVTLCTEIDMTVQFGQLDRGPLPYHFKEPFSLDKQYNGKMGFLLDASAGKLSVIDVTGSCVVCSGHVDTSEPLWPVIYMTCDRDGIQADVRVEIESGQRLAMPRSLVKLLKNALRE